MPSVWSKVLMPEWALPYNCYEIGHTWNPNCDEAALDMTFTVFKESLKLYTPLYIFNAIMKRKLNTKIVISIITNTLRSSSFLGFTALLMMSMFCNIRKVTGKFYYTLCSYLPVFISSLLAILIEKRSRRGALAVYCANIASETVYRMLINRHIVKPIARGEVLIFTVSISALLFMVRRYGYGRDPVCVGLKVMLGREKSVKVNNESAIEMSNKCDNCVISDHTFDTSDNKRDNTDNNSNAVQSKLILNTMRQKCGFIVSLIGNYFERHPKCNHRQRSCVSNSLSYFMVNFAIGWTAQVLMNTLMRPKRLITSPKTVIISGLTDSNNVYFGLFLGSFSAVFKSVNCLLRRFTNTSQDWHSLVAALCAGPTMYLSSNTMNTTIALYLLWKSIEMLYLMAVRKGWLGYKDQTIMLLYAMSTAQLAYVTIMEPRAMRPSYLKFIDKITGHKMSSFNRTVLDVFGTGSSLGYEHNVFPNLCPNHTTRQFKENVINWIIS